MSNISKMFPVIFYLVAVLISLTSMTRMIEEERVEIGTLKAMGYTNMQIISKYIIYSLFACIIGGVLGMTVGLYLLPNIVWMLYAMIYNLPEFYCTYRVEIGLLGIIIAFICIGGATIIVATNELKQMPAVLMRPKPPKKGKRILLERIGFIWKRFNFSQKVTARNIFRYKKRAIMTIIGIAGCTGLMLTGFGIRDSVIDIPSVQFRKIFSYDLSISLTNTKGLGELNEYFSNNENIQNYTEICATTAKLGEKNYNVTVFVPKNTEDLNNSFNLTNPKTGEIYAISGWHNYKDGNKYDAYDYGVGAILDAVTPGSIVKGASILVGYKEKVIDIGSKILDECISYNNMPEKCSWKTLGFINDLDALKWSSNIYMFKTAMMVGGQPYGTSKYLNLNLDAFDKYRSMFYQFGLGVKTGIDFPSEGEGVKGYSKDSDLLINYAIGQYDTYTPLEISQYITTIASNGKRIKPRFLSKVIDTDGNIIKNEAPTILNTIDIEDKYIKRVQEGFRLCIVSGTCYDFMGQKVKGAGKTGTSESFVDRGDGIYDHPTMSNNFIGYAPYNNPVMTLTVSSPDILDMETGTYRAEVNYRISKKVSNLFFTLYNEDGTRK